MFVNNNLRVLMAKHELNIDQVHQKTELSRTTISKLYNKTSKSISFNTVVELCDLFDCSIGDLLYLDTEEKRD